MESWEATIIITTKTRVPGKTQSLCCWCCCVEPVFIKSQQKTIQTTIPMMESFMTLRKLKELARNKIREYCHDIKWFASLRFISPHRQPYGHYVNCIGTHILREGNDLTLINGEKSISLKPQIEIRVSIDLESPMQEEKTYMVINA
jgi:hypothetical protein